MRNKRQAKSAAATIDPLDTSRTSAAKQLKLSCPLTITNAIYAHWRNMLIGKRCPPISRMPLTPSWRRRPERNQVLRSPCALC